MISSESKQARLARKQEAKKLKQQRIIDSGGKRPRKRRSEEVDADNDESPSKQNNNSLHQSNVGGGKKKKHKKSNNKNSNYQSNNNVNRFGRVMINTPCPNKPRHSTLSIAIPGSIVSNAQTMELRTYLVGQIARACTVYHVDEIVVFDDNLSQELKVRTGYHRGSQRHGGRDFHRDRNNNRGAGNGHGDGRGRGDEAKNAASDGNNEEDGKDEKEDETKKLTPSTDPHTFMANILQYCECPQYLRRHFFPMHPDLQFAGLLNPLDAPHHVRALDRCLFRDGIVTDKQGKGFEDQDPGSLVDCGIRGKLVEIDRVLPKGIRCTVQIDLKGYGAPGKKNIRGKVVSPSAPREHDGTYWGYSVRMAPSIKAIFDEAPFKNGYDLKIGTSERGTISVDDTNFLHKVGQQLNSTTSPPSTSSNTAPSFSHAVIVFGGVAGIEECVDADETINISGNNCSSLFDLWVNICEFQGSRTIRTEEAVLIGLSRLCPFLFPIHNENNHASSDDAIQNDQNSKNEVKVIEFSDEEPSDEESSSDEDSD